MKHKALIFYFTLLAILCTVFIIGARMAGQYGAYLAQGYMMTPAIAALLTRLFFYPPKFSDANLRFGRLKDYLKFWLISLGITGVSYISFTVLGGITWDFSGRVFLDKLAQQFAVTGQDIQAALPPGFTPSMMLLIYTIGGLLWYLWHIPLAFVIPQATKSPFWQTTLNLLILALGSICTHTYLAYVYTKSESIFVTALAHITMNNTTASFSYYAVIQNQVACNLGLTLTMLLTIAILYFRKELRVFAKYFCATKTG